MKTFSLLKMTFIFLFGLKAFALGGWSSGGGELLKDSRNPWFLNNTKEVFYCIAIDEKNFGLSKATAEGLVAQALEFWTKEFQQAMAPSPSQLGPIKIASQKFRKTHCKSAVDITFQFGQLSPAQKKYLRNPSEYAAITVRTDYSNKEMRGKGFIYVSPAQGPLAYNHEGVLKNAWSKNPDFLYLTLLHELGHVFGLPHMGSLNDLMSEGFVEAILAEAKSFESRPETPHFFSLPQKSPVMCPEEILLSKWRDFFGLESTDKCVQFTFTHDNGNQLFRGTQMRVLAGASKDEPLRKVAELNLTIGRFFPSFLNIIWLPEGQTLFSKEDLLKSGYRGVLGISLMTVSKTGSFLVNGNRDKRGISVRFEQGGNNFYIDGVDSTGNFVTIL